MPATAPNIPDAWKNPARIEKWNALPPDVKAALIEREAEVTKGFTRLDEERNFGKQVRDVVTPYLPMIQAEGGNPTGAIQSLLNTAYQLRTATPQQKGKLLNELAQQYGADMSQIQVSSAQYVDPQVQTLQQRLDAMEHATRTEKQQKEYHQQSEAMNAISVFAADPAHPHFDTVVPHMQALLEKGLATGLQDAYDQAVFARTDIRSTILAEQQAAAEAKRIADIKSRSNAARRASISVTGAPGVAVPSKAAQDGLSLRDEIAKNLREHLH